MTHRLKDTKLIYITENIIKSLAQNRISTILEFLQEDVIKLATITKLTIAQIVDVRNDIFSKYSAPVVSGLTILEQISTRRVKLSTGLESIDTILDGGIPVGSLSEICGLADSGKTQLCFQLAINCVKHSNDTVLYIDTKGDFSAVRIQKILESSGFSHEEMATILYKIKVIRVWTLSEMIELFQKLKKSSITLEKLALIIIDSLPCLMFQFLGVENKIGLTLLNTLVNYSRYLSKELNISMVCVNIQTRWIDQDIADLEEDFNQTGEVSKEPYIEKRNRCLGKYWQQIPALVLLVEKNLQSTTEIQKIDVLVLKSNTPEIINRKCTLSLCLSGLR